MTTSKIRTYTIGVNPSNGRETLTVHATMVNVPYNVWRDLGRLAGLSYDNLAGHLVYEFLVPGKMERAEEILRGAMWERRG